MKLLICSLESNCKKNTLLNMQFITIATNKILSRKWCSYVFIVIDKEFSSECVAFVDFEDDLNYIKYNWTNNTFKLYYSFIYIWGN